jgi:hypothetical protein
MFERRGLMLAGAAGPVAPNVRQVVDLRIMGATGDGRTDDTQALARALATAAEQGGGAITLPPGIYSIRPDQLRLPPNTSMIGMGRASVLRRIGPGTLLDASGRSTEQRVGGCLLRDLVLDGNGGTGTLLRAWFAHDLVLENVWNRNNAGLALDGAELWDSRFINCTWDWCSGADGRSPAVLLRDRPGREGPGGDNSNALYFVNCRWESFRDGALWIAQVGQSANSQVYMVNCKMESSYVRGPFLRIAPATRNVIVQNLYLCGNAFDRGTAIPVDLVQLNAQALARLENVCVWLNAPVARTVVRSDVGHASCAIENVWVDGPIAPTVAIVEHAGAVRARTAQIGFLGKASGLAER